jgi:hypothetical protein
MLPVPAPESFEAVLSVTPQSEMARNTSSHMKISRNMHFSWPHALLTAIHLITSIQ